MGRFLSARRNLLCSGSSAKLQVAHWLAIPMANHILSMERFGRTKNGQRPMAKSYEKRNLHPKKTVISFADGDLSSA